MGLATVIEGLKAKPDQRGFFKATTAGELKFENGAGGPNQFEAFV